MQLAGTWRPLRRGLPLAGVAALHAAVIAAVIAFPATRERLLAPAVLDVVMVREERRSPLPPPLPVVPPRIRDVVPIAVPVPEVRIAAPAPAEAITARAQPVVPAAPVAVESAPAPATAPAPIEPPRFDMAYLRNPAPAYPPISRRLKEEGRVILRVRVGTGGEARDVVIGTSSGFERLDRAAIEAVRAWHFAPAKRGAEPVEAWALVPISFRLDA